MEQAPKWLPYRVRKMLDQWRINRVLRALDQVPPIAADTFDHAHAEVFMLVCKRDLRLGCLSLKSLLHQRGDTRLAVTLIDDGSLKTVDRQWFDRQVSNIRWQSNRDIQVLQHPSIRNMPHTAALYKSLTFPLMSKVLHPFLFNRTKRVVLLDTDTAFFKQPSKLLDYCAGNSHLPLYMHDHQDESKVIPDDIAPMFSQLAQSLDLPGDRFQLSHWLFNSGLLAFEPQQLDLFVTERYLAWLEKSPSSVSQGKRSIWFGPWTREQTAYMLMFASGPAKAQPLGDDYWLGGAQDRVFNHFLRFYLVRKSCLQMLAGLIQRLKCESR